MSTRSCNEKGSGTMYRKLAIVLLIASGIIYSAYTSLNFVLCKTIESRLTRTLGLKTKIGSFRLIPWRGIIAIEKISISNPDGFSSKSFFKMKECTATVNLTTLMQDIIVIEELKLRGIDITVEHNKNALNLDYLKHKVQLQDHREDESEAYRQEEKKTRVPGKRFIINHLKAKNSGVAFASASQGLRAIHFKIPDVVIDNPSQTACGALTADEILYQFICAVIDKLAAQGPSNYQKEIKKFLMEQLENYYKK
jgi:uncharacterized protein involved in outer membrane biogenesis